MLEPSSNNELPPIPGKRYFTIGEVSELCGVKPRYYQRQDVMTVRQIRDLLYLQGFTIGGARQKLSGKEVRHDHSRSRQIVRQVRKELEEVLTALKT